MYQISLVMNNLRLAFHGELDREQKKQAALIYIDERNWGPVIKADFNCQGYYPSSISEMAELIEADAAVRDALFPSGQLVLLGKEEEQWRVFGSIHTIVSNDGLVKGSFTQPDTWNVFTNHRQPEPEKYDPQGNRWVCFAIQTDQSLDREKWAIKPADIIIRGVRLLAYGIENEYDAVQKEVQISPEVQKSMGKYPITSINPLTRLSGFSAFKAKYPTITAADYARNVESLVLAKKNPENQFEHDFQEMTKRCSLRYHLSRGARLEQVIEKFRIHDAASLGYGASVLYSR